MKTRTKRIKTATVHGWTGQGETATEAKADAIARIEAAAEGTWAPAVIRWRGMVAFIWREPSQWCYAIHRPGNADCEYHVSYTTSYATRDECIRRASAHIAQNGYRDSDDWRCIPYFVTDAEDRRELRHWQQWQSICAEARRRGLDGNAAWQFACDHHGEFAHISALTDANDMDLSSHE